MELSPENQLILSCIKIQSTHEELNHIIELIYRIQDWDYVVTTIINRGIGPLFYKKLPLLTNNYLIPEFVKNNLQKVYYKTYIRSTILYEHFRLITEEFNAQNIQVIALKGIYLSEYLYKDIGLRQFSDIDLLVKEDEAEKSLSILKKMGYVPTLPNISEFVHKHSEIVHFYPMIKNGVSIEIHIKLHLKTNRYNILLPTLWTNSIPVTLNGVQIYTLSINDLLIYLCIHLDKHFQEGKVQFTCFSDITNILELYSETIDWIIFTNVCQLYNCEDVVFKYLVLVNKYMNAKLPIVVLNNYQSLLTIKDEQLFYNFLQGKFINLIPLSAHFRNLKLLQNFPEYIVYLWSVTFPPKAFMIQRYDIRRNLCVYFYYPYRYYIGIKGVINHLRKH